MTETVEVRDAEAIRTVVDLAREIWTEHYVPLIGPDQVEYMLARFQSEEAVEGQIREGHRYFLIRAEGKAAGYLAVVPDSATGRMLLSKIYVLKAMRGKGLGRAGVAYAEGLCRDAGHRILWLRVNRNNLGSVQAYEQMGFEKTGLLVSEIGNGFVMDDFQMEKRITG
jgi:GNAT superfamily N-acetyltransferase